ncbi:MAG: xanthine dehydrogenase family protein subunit M [Candidatus Aminicenantes bacterium]|nr:xanthine dehydrogenase family protein subunit M [Candidatus Aminicenantes bacterium]MDH5706808.1 xanthine dehydrogenase family protein subunit M [Candidatus Aminicenantes bacterium]
MIRDFIYLKAGSVKEALDLLDKHKDDYKIICGGQSLLILMRQGLVAPENLIDIKGMKELSYIKFNSKTGLRIGATTIHREIEKSSVIKKHYPVLVDMEKNLASIQTRNWGTIGGNLAHADPAGDPGALLMALNARVSMANKERVRALLLEEFFVDFFETALEEGELLLEVQVPPVPPRTATAYEKFNIIKNDQGIVSVAASLTLNEDGLRCKDARLVLGGSAPVPLRAKEAEAMLKGRKVTEGLLEQVGSRASEEADPVADIHASEGYRRHLVKALTKRMVKRAWEHARTLAH